ncbi:TrmH family RNA methyltransferase [Spirosoma utsteinense]|uniref:TrmH family RNA methyltransferase n=1 Tax=Spirosoma utsteinense TaxID=2585773 RepID=A0ABR6W626_9BACT|nr:RNA methyltransferase [Spirosoma utsteinense]MBC3785866.1 TrmH family RNA methyltransferase [Spirosoma utsteinense]MBC3792038.1 TrmH family RNA methyltransferase [Spirosoma utsteinense]
MLSKNQIKYIQSLHQKKFRQQHGSFLVEGAKSVEEVLLSDFETELVVATDAFYKENSRLTDNQRTRVEIASVADLERIGTLNSNNAAIAVVRTKENRPLVAEPGEIALILDDIRDPGNLGTILRIADWYGIRTVLCSETTADVYNPKVISASKGSFTRVRWWYGDIVQFLGESVSPAPVYGAFLNGTDVHTLPFEPSGYLVMGNESNGISTAVEQHVTQRVTIPRYGDAESLNVGIATAVLLDNWRRSRG